MNKLISASAIVLALTTPAYAGSGHNHGNHSGHNHGGHDHDKHEEVDDVFNGHLDVKVHLDRIVDAAEADEEFDEVYTHSHLQFRVAINPSVSLLSNIKFEGEPAGHAHGHDEEEEEEVHGDRFFDDHPLLVEHLTLNYDQGDYSFYIGKFSPVVGFDYHNFPGIFAYQTIESYAIRERVGLGARLNFGDHAQHSLNLSSFFTDTTLFSNSIFHERGRTRKDDGGVSNTENPQSFALSLSGSSIGRSDHDLDNGLSYRLGYADQAAGINNEEDETRYSGSLGYRHKLTDDLNLHYIVEHMAIDHLGGEAAHDRSYTTIGFGIDYDRWNIGATYTSINNKAEEEDESHNGGISQLSVGYTFGTGIGLSIGYQRADEDGEVADRVGALLSYSYDL